VQIDGKMGSRQTGSDVSMDEVTLVVFGEQGGDGLRSQAACFVLQTKARLLNLCVLAANNLGRN